MSLPRVLLGLLMPSTFAAAACSTGVVLLATGARRLGRGMLGLGVGMFVALYWLPVDQWLLLPLEDRFGTPSPPPAVDGILVLGGGVSTALSDARAQPVPNRDGERLMEFVALSRRYPAARLVFAGGSPPHDAGAEAAASARIFQALGLAPERVVFENLSQTTWENAVNALALVKPEPGQRWLLVTSASHMPRAVGAFRAAGWPDVTAWPVAYRSTPHWWSAPAQPFGETLAGLDVAAHEWIGLVVYHLRGRTDRLLPRPHPG